MNQILMTNDKNNGVQVVLMKPVIKFFCIVAIVFAIILAGQGLFKEVLSKNNGEGPKIERTVRKNGSDIILKFSSDVAISRVNYRWNDGEETEFKADGRKIFDIQTGIPDGENVMYMTAQDVNGNKVKFDDLQVDFTDTEDSIKPTVSVEPAEQDRKVKIIATDDKELDYLTYKWEDEEPVIIKADEENKTVIEQEIEVQKGIKKLTIQAVDKTGNTSKQDERTIIGSEGSQIKVTLVDGNFVVNVTDEYQINRITYTLNDEPFSVDGIPENAKEFEFKVPLREGVTNYLKINVYETESDNLMTEYKCKKSN